MDLLDIYLLRKGKSRTDVASENDIDAHILYPQQPEKPSTLPSEALSAIAHSAGMTKDRTKLDLVELEDNEQYTEVSEASELLYALTNKEAHIVIRGDFLDTFKNRYQMPMTEKEQLGTDLGMRGYARLLESFFYWVIGLFRNETKTKATIDKKMKNYTIRYFKPEGALLYLKQLEY